MPLFAKFGVSPVIIEPVPYNVGHSHELLFDTVHLNDTAFDTLDSRSDRRLLRINLAASPCPFQIPLSDLGLTETDSNSTLRV